MRRDLLSGTVGVAPGVHFGTHIGIASGFRGGITETVPGVSQGFSPDILSPTSCGNARSAEKSSSCSGCEIKGISEKLRADVAVFPLKQQDEFQSHSVPTVRHSFRGTEVR